jgi:Tfp pilus assembly protein PilF
VKKSIFQKTFTHLILIVTLSLIAYSNTFHVPFHFDDDDAIVNNPIIKNFQFFSSPSKSTVLTEHFGYHTFRSRYIGYLTFALNYSIHGLDTTGYHIVNLVIHICTALLVYLLVYLTFQTPILLASELRDYSRQIALFAALLFACHPVQTEAVTYIWQRVASLATMFYILSLTAYVKWRLSGYQSTASQSSNLFRVRTVPIYLTSLVSAVLAMKTKQIAFTLPIMISLYEGMFFQGKIARRLLFLLPILLTLLIIPLTLLDLEKPLEDVIGDVSEVSRDLTRMSRLDYLFTQFRVIVKYLRLIVLPINQNLDYDHPVFHSFFTTEVFLSFLLLVTILCSGMYLLYRSRYSSPHMRIIAFGIFWFFITLSVEFSFIPIKEIMFEYRVYLPSVGVFLFLSTICFIIMRSVENRWKSIGNIVMPTLFVIILVLTGATYARNAVWKDEVTMWEDIVSKSPYKGRAHTGLGKAYRSQGLFSKAIEQYNISLRLNPYDLATYNNLGNAYASLGQLDTAIHYLQTAIKFESNLKDTHYNLGHVYQLQGLMDKAIKEYKIAISLNPFFAKAHYNLGLAYQSKGLIDKANEHFKITRQLNPALIKGRETQNKFMQDFKR